VCNLKPRVVGPCYHGMVRPQVAQRAAFPRGTAPQSRWRQEDNWRCVAEHCSSFCLVICC